MDPNLLFWDKSAIINVFCKGCASTFRAYTFNMSLSRALWGGALAMHLQDLHVGQRVRVLGDDPLEP